MRCYFCLRLNCFVDYFNDTVPDGLVIYVGDILFWYNEQERSYTDSFWDKPTGNIFLTASRDHEFLLSHNLCYMLHSLPESKKLNHNYIEKSSSNSTIHTQVSTSDPSDPLTVTKRDAKAEYLGLIRTALGNTIHSVNFADPV